MELGIDLNLVRSQKLLLIPQLKQALEILGMNSNELFTYVEGQLETNPLLEMNMDDRLLYSNDAEECDESCHETSIALTLKEHLLFQLESLDFDKVQRRIGEYLIDNTDENGYLTIQVREVAAFFNVSASIVSKVINKLQGFDPPGICARNLKECLGIQLHQMDNVNENAILIVENHLDLLAENDIEAAVYATGIDKAAIVEAFQLIRTLEPRPGREFYKNEDERPAVADVTIRNIGKNYWVVLNDEAFPEINISEAYNLDKINADTGPYIRDKLHSAIWMIKCMEQRKNIILQIAEYILKEEAAFFEKGTSFLKAVSKKRLENALGIHESVLMEAIKGKHLHCRWGMYDFSYFIK